jgi:crotonobetainyl-CoA:carnitine CoA-transferase CaiB-like acyl-CoA transferase
VAVSVADDSAWEALRSVEGLESLADDPRFETLAERLANFDELDAVICEWTELRTAWECSVELQRAGVPAHPLFDHWDVLADPQLASRQFFRVLPSTRFGAELTYGQAVVLSETPANFTRAAPAFGEHTRDILKVVGLTEPEIDGLITSGIAHEMPHPGLRLERPYLGWVPHLLRLPWPDSTVDPAQIIFDRMSEQLPSHD